MSQLFYSATSLAHVIFNFDIIFGNLLMGNLYLNVKSLHLWMCDRRKARYKNILTGLGQKQTTNKP